MAGYTASDFLEDIQYARAQAATPQSEKVIRVGTGISGVIRENKAFWVDIQAEARQQSGRGQPYVELLNMTELALRHGVTLSEALSVWGNRDLNWEVGQYGFRLKYRLITKMFYTTLPGNDKMLDHGWQGKALYLVAEPKKPWWMVWKR